VNIQVASSTASSSDFVSFVLGRLRHAQARIDLASNEISFALVGVRSGWLGPDDVVAHLTETGLFSFVFPTGYSS
jgi:hypothetical protein